MNLALNTIGCFLEENYPDFYIMESTNHKTGLYLIRVLNKHAGDHIIAIYASILGENKHECIVVRDFIENMSMTDYHFYSYTDVLVKISEILSRERTTAKSDR